MAKIYQFPTPLTGSTATFPNFKYMVVGDNLATVTAAGYLKQNDLQGYPLSSTDVLQLFYSYDLVAKTGTFGTFSVAIDGTGTITLTEYQPAAGVNATLPTIVNHIATYSNTGGDITEDAATAINAGHIQAGLATGTAGSLISMPGTANKGSLQVTAANNTGNTITTITNASMGQATVFTIPDPAQATATFNLTTAPLVNNNLIKASGTGGLVADSGIVATNVQLKSGVFARQQTFVNPGVGPVTFAAPGITFSSPIVGDIISSTNAGIYIVNIGYGGIADTAQVLFSADPGASCKISFQMYVVPQ